MIARSRSDACPDDFHGSYDTSGTQRHGIDSAVPEPERDDNSVATGCHCMMVIAAEPKTGRPMAMIPTTMSNMVKTMPESLIMRVLLAVLR